MNKTSPTVVGTTARPLAKGIGIAVAERTILRVKPDGSRETWAEVAHRVALGNSMLRKEGELFEFGALHKHLLQASVLMSGRHLQHGDETQPGRNIEVFSNCSTSASTFILFYLLLNGSGVGTCYDDDMSLVDWSKNMPFVLPVISSTHPDVVAGLIGQEFVTPDMTTGGIAGAESSLLFEVPDSREGWAKAIEKIEFLTWQGKSANSILLLDFSKVRAKGEPIRGMQNRPASGPGPLMDAIRNIATIKGSGMEPWEAAMHADHHVAECVLVGGARRAARMATKTWRDKSIFKFISIKKGGVLWSSNNSITADEEFWKLVKADIRDVQKHESAATVALAEHAKKVFEAICAASYHDGTGEPGLINVQYLTQKDEGVEALFDGDYAESDRFKLDPETKQMTAALAKVFAGKRFKMITNPCGEIALTIIGGYCLIADVVPYHAAQGASTWDASAEDAFRTAVRALLRTNTMNALYQKEVDRTNRIGVGMTGLHEYAWARFGYGWKDLINETKSIDFWRTLSRFSNACVDEARKYSAMLGVAMPHTVTTMKPAGTTSKLFGLTEGAHLPSMREYLRWVQFRSDDPLIQQYRDGGYPVRDNLKSYKGTTIVGFPTVPEICNLGMEDKLVTASEATPEEQYEFLRLLEKWWIDGYTEEHGRHSYGNQNSYTLKYKTSVTSYETFRATLLAGQSTVKCCSVMPEGDTSAYEYLPEEPISPERFREVVAKISNTLVKEDIGLEHVDCASGACPISFDQGEKSA